MKNNNDNLSNFWLILSNTAPPVGIFLYFRHRKQYPNKAKKALVSALTGIPIAVLAGYIMNTYILS